MGYKRWRSARLPFFYGMSLCILFLCSFIMGGCDSRRDLPTDPVIAPVIVPFDLAYDDQTGTVVLDWEYLGVNPPVRFRFLRVEREGIRFLDWADLPMSSRPVEERADVWDMDPVVDAVPNAGEEYAYIMRTETAFERSSESPLGQVQIPGARLENIVLHSESSTATIKWSIPTGAPRQMELLRQVSDEAPLVVHQSNRLTDTTFVDVLPEGNVTYRYVLRNSMDHGVVLDSRAFILQTYPQLSAFQVSEPLDTHVFLTPSMNFTSDILVLLANENFVAVRGLRVTGYVPDPQELPLQNREQLNLGSLSVSVTPIGKPRMTRTLLVGILPERRDVQLSAFVLDRDNFVEIPWQYQAWSVDNPNMSTTTFVGPDGTIWVGVGKVLRAFRSEGDGVVEVGHFDLNISGGLKDLIAFESSLWIVTTDGQVLKSSFMQDAIDGATSLAWESVALPAGAQVMSISGHDQAIFALDHATGRVLVFDFDGSLGLWWRGLDGLDLSDGGLAVSRQGDVYVWDVQNQMVLFKNVPAFLEKFPEPEN